MGDGNRCPAAAATRFASRVGRTFKLPRPVSATSRFAENIAIALTNRVEARVDVGRALAGGA